MMIVSTHMTSSSRYASMVVLPKEEYLELQQQQHQSSSPLEKKYEKVLHQYRDHTHIKDPIEQHYKQGEDLNELRRLREKMNTYYFKDDKQRGSLLLSLLSPSFLDYNRAGELIDKRTNQTVSGSRIDDLITYAVNPSHPDPTAAAASPPHGWKEFVSILKSVPHIPHHVLNSHTREELSPVPPPPPSSFSSPKSSPPTSVASSPPAPETRKRKSDTPAHLHCPRTRAKAKRSNEANEVAKYLLSSSSFRKF